jgi:hypothetical protein
VETETEKKVDSATVEKIKTAVADIVRTVNRGQTSAAADPAAAGETVRNTKTPGGLYDQETEVETPAAFDSGNITLKGVLGNSILRVYMNQTAEQIGVIATNMNPLYTYHGLPSFNPRNGRWDWVLLRDPLVLDGWDTWNKENLTRVFLEFREYEGRMYRVTTTQTYTDKQDFGVKAAREEYSGAGPGSVFHTFGRDGYHYIKVTDESVETEDVTSDWLNGVPIEWSEA